MGGPGRNQLLSHLKKTTKHPRVISCLFAYKKTNISWFSGRSEHQWAHGKQLACSAKNREQGRREENVATLTSRSNKLLSKIKPSNQLLSLTQLLEGVSPSATLPPYAHTHTLDYSGSWHPDSMPEVKFKRWLVSKLKPVKATVRSWAIAPLLPNFFFDFTCLVGNTKEVSI